VTAEIQVTRWGAGPPVVMVHGSAQGSPASGPEQFAAQRPLADGGWELVLPDRPGHGRSHSRGPEDLETDAVWVAELLGDGADLVGHSYGGAIALCAAGLRPQAVRSLTLIEAPIFSVVPDDPAAQAFEGQLASAIAQDDPIATMVSFSQVAGIPRGLLGPPPSPEQLARMGEGLRQMRPPGTWDAGPTIDVVAAAKIPALLVTGGWNPAFEAIADELARRLHGQRLVIDAGHHFPHLAAGEENVSGAEFNHALKGFLRLDRAPRVSAPSV
jgi:pimeloyl-ACP methyl ester carboxylesterase